MAKKAKSPIDGLDPQQLQAGLRESAQQIWMAGLGAFAKAQAGGNKVFEALMKDGGALHSTRQAAREQVDDMAAKASGTWDKLEQVFEKRVAQTLHTLGVPTHEDVETLSRRVAELSALVESLRPPAKPRAASKAPAPAPAKRRAGAAASAAAKRTAAGPTKPPAVKRKPAAKPQAATKRTRAGKAAA